MAANKNVDDMEGIEDTSAVMVISPLLSSSLPR